ncbi:hypothetical protein J6590_074550 [Homalodisca vitripennis]|nr:hypothetical protein J6590_074550 [Homalodisca vitripennis]
MLMCKSLSSSMAWQIRIYRIESSVGEILLPSSRTVGYYTVTSSVALNSAIWCMLMCKSLSSSMAWQIRIYRIESSPHRRLLYCHIKCCTQQRHCDAGVNDKYAEKSYIVVYAHVIESSVGEILLPSSRTVGYYTVTSSVALNSDILMLDGVCSCVSPYRLQWLGRYGSTGLSLPLLYCHIKCCTQQRHSDAGVTDKYAENPYRLQWLGRYGSTGLSFPWVKYCFRLAAPLSEIDMNTMNRPADALANIDLLPYFDHDLWVTDIIAAVIPAFKCSTYERYDDADFQKEPLHAKQLAAAAHHALLLIDTSYSCSHHYNIFCFSISSCSSCYLADSSSSESKPIVPIIENYAARQLFWLLSYASFPYAPGLLEKPSLSKVDVVSFLRTQIVSRFQLSLLRRCQLNIVQQNVAFRTFFEYNPSQSRRLCFTS